MGSSECVISEKNKREERKEKAFSMGVRSEGSYVWEFSVFVRICLIEISFR